MTKRRPATRRRPARRGPVVRQRTSRPAKRSTRTGGVLAALRQLWAALFHRATPPAGGGAGGTAPYSKHLDYRHQRRGRWDDEQDRDEYGRWPDRDLLDEDEAGTTERGTEPPQPAA